MIDRRLAQLLTAALALLALVVPGAAHARDDARVEVSCGGGAEAELRAEADDGAIEIELRIDSRRSGERWRIALVHERRVAWRGSGRTRGGGALRIRRTLPDYAGADEVTARATGPRGVTCQATAQLSGD